MVIIVCINVSYQHRFFALSARFDLHYDNGNDQIHICELKYILLINQSIHQALHMGELQEGNWVNKRFKIALYR